MTLFKCYLSATLSKSSGLSAVCLELVLMCVWIHLIVLFYRSLVVHPSHSFAVFRIGVLRGQSDVIHLAAKSSICHQSRRLLPLFYIHILSTTPGHSIVSKYLKAGGCNVLMSTTIYLDSPFSWYFWRRIPHCHEPISY
jgi:hypothetical protein